MARRVGLDETLLGHPVDLVCNRCRIDFEAIEDRPPATDDVEGDRRVSKSRATLLLDVGRGRLDKLELNVDRSDLATIGQLDGGA